MKAIALILMVAIGLIAQVPTRTVRPAILPPLPPEPSGAEVARSTKKDRAAALRKEAEALEAEVKRERDMEELGASISSQLSVMIFSTPRFDVRLGSVSFMEVGTNLLMQATFDYAEK